MKRAILLGLLIFIGLFLLIKSVDLSDIESIIIEKIYSNGKGKILDDSSVLVKTSPPEDSSSLVSLDGGGGDQGIIFLSNNPLNFITVTEKSHQTIQNYPIQTARPFIQGEISNYPQAVLNNVPLQTQADVKQRWPDGSVKHAILTFYIPSLNADSSLQIFFQNQLDGNNEGYLTQQNMLQSQYNFDAVMDLTSNAQVRSVSARDMLIAGDLTYWMQGSIATSIILADHSSQRTYDIGFNQYRPFRPIYHATFFPLINKIRVRYIGEAANTEELGEFSYNLALKLGLSPQTLVYTKNAFTQNSASRWTKEFWIGGAPSAVNIDHNLPYLIQTFFVPNYDTSKVIPESKISSDYSEWIGAQKDIGNSALWQIDMGSTGGRRDIGPYTDWVVRWLYTGDYRSKEIASGLADLAGAWPVQFREARQGTYFLRGSTAVSALGKVISITARPNVQGRLLNGEGSDAVTYVGPATSSWVPDGAHLPDPYSVLYTLTGDYWYLEQMYFWSSWSAAKFAAGNANELRLNYFRGPSGEFGGIQDQVRGEAWVFRFRTQTAFLAPDTDTEKTYFTTLANDAIARWEGQRDIPCSTCANYPDNTRVWDWANTFGKGRWIQNGPYPETHNLGIPPLHHWASFNNLLLPGPTNPINETITTSVSATWEENMLLYALGRGKELGFATDALLTWLAPYLIGQLTNPSYDPYLTIAYMTPTAKQVSGQWYGTWHTTWGEVKNGFKSWYYNPQDSRYARNYFESNSLGDTIHGYAYIIIPGLSMITDKPGGTEAWNLANQLILTAPNNPLALQKQNENPKWLILPRISSGSSPFDYSLFITPTTQTVQQGQTTQPYILTVTSLSGIPEGVVFTAPSLPLGVTAQFTPASCTPTLTQSCTSNMVLQTSSTTPAQSYSLSVTGRSLLNNTLKQANYNLGVSQNLVLTSLNPNYIQNGVSQTVQLIGTGFSTASCDVNVNGNLASSLNYTVNCVSDQRINLTVPGSISVGTYSLSAVTLNSGAIIGTSNSLPLTVTQGSAVDSDGDGVPDTIDRCSNTPSYAVTTYGINRFNGCPIPPIYPMSTSLTTDFSNVPDLFNVENLRIGIIGKSAITFNRPINVLWRNNTGPLVAHELPIGFGEWAINITKNLIFINSTKRPIFNVSAEVTFFDTGLTNPVLYKDGVICDSSKCYILSFDTIFGDVVANVSGFSSYSVSQGSCGDSICSIAESCSSCSADCGSCQGTGGGSSGGSGGGGRTSSGPVINRVVTQCSDGLDNDGDGLIDYSADKGCFNVDDNVELDSSQLEGYSDNGEIDKINKEVSSKVNKDIRFIFWIILSTLMMGIAISLILILKHLRIHRRYVQMSKIALDKS
ncbi:MAG: hypothetical protein AABW89_01080 [Nanoarchaeota archaeon]